MKCINNLLILCLFCISITATASPIAPTITYKVEYLGDEPTVTIFWNEVAGAIKYKLLYAPIPYTGTASIASLDIGSVTSFTATLWDGASFYVAVQAGDDTGFSSYSNIESVTILPKVPLNIAGNWTASGSITPSPINTCNTIPATQISGIASINQLQDSVTMTIPAMDTSFSGTIVEEELNVIGFPSIGGVTNTAVISFIIASDYRNLTAVGSVGTSQECSGMINLTLSR